MHYTRRFTFDAAGALAFRLEKVLARLGIEVAPGSTVERMTLNTWDVMQRHLSGVSQSEESDIRRQFGDLAALAELGIQLVAASSHRDFAALKPHLSLLNRGEASQNRPASVVDQEANKIFELLTACYSMQMGSHVEVDHPDRSGGSNPDVLFSVQEGRLGVACKVIHSSAPQTILNRVEEGIDQIERAPCRTGFVFLSLKNVLDHESYWPVRITPEGKRLFTAYPSFAGAVSQLRAELESFRVSLLDHVGSPDPIRDLFHGRKAQPVMVFYAHVMSGVVVDGAPAATSIKLPYAIRAAECDDWFNRRLEQLNRVMQDIPDD